MRPLELRLKSFRSYSATETVFDFRMRRLVAIVGPIGSGKTSVLDAVSFALYGKTPRIGRDIRSLVHQRADGCHVSFRFRVSDDIWQAERSLRRSGQSQHKLSRFAADTAEAEPAETITQARTVTTRIEELVGMDFDAFQRTVLLAQGAFARFLEMGPAERDTLLKTILGYGKVDRIRSAAKERGGALGAELSGVEARLEAVAQARTDLDGVAEKIENAVAQHADLARIADDVAALTGRIAAADESRRAAEERRNGLAFIDLPDVAGTESLLERTEDAESALEAAGEQLEGAEAAAAAAAEEAVRREPSRDTAVKARAGLAKLEPLAAAERRANENHAAAAEQATAAAERAATAGKSVDEAQRVAAAAAARMESAQAALDETRHALFAAERADMAGALARELVVGESCPVCGRPVDELPPTIAAGEKAEVAAAAATAEEELAGATAARTEADAARARAAAESAGAAEGTAAAEARLRRAASEANTTAAAAAAVAQELGALLGKGEPESRLRQIDETLAAADTGLEEARRAVARLRDDVAAKSAERRALDSALNDLVVRIAGAASKLGVEVEIAPEAESLRDGVARLRLDLERQQNAVSEEIAAADAESAQAGDALALLLKEHGITDSHELAVARAQQRLDDLRGRAAVLEERLAASSELEEEQARLATARGHYATLSADLVDSRFVAFLLEADRSDLVRVAGEHFDRLSSGRYRFDESRELTVVDATAAASRSFGSLSGGETFLASLALALALADMVSRTGAHRDAFFLDEGFGTLDGDHLELAMNGIESLVDGGGERLVVVVSHRPEIKDRIDDLIVLDRDATTGDTIVVRA